jgi:hypothetical protein
MELHHQGISLETLYSGNWFAWCRILYEKAILLHMAGEKWMMTEWCPTQLDMNNSTTID